MSNRQSEKNIVQPWELSPLSLNLSRRDLMGWAGRGAVGLTALALLDGGAAFGAREGVGESRLFAQGLGASAALPPMLNFPLWGDLAGWNQPQYYETICTGDVNGDGQDELIIRGPNGIQVHVFDSGSGQWMPLPNSPTDWSDANGWNQPQYYTTIQCADLDGDGHDEIVARGKDGLVGYKYNVSSMTFEAITSAGSDAFSDNGGWYLPQYYATIHCGDVDGDGKAELIARGYADIIVWKYYSNGWVAISRGPQWADDPNSSPDGTQWSLPQYYETIQLADVDGDGADEVIGRSKNGIEVWKFSGGNWSYTQGPSWTDSGGYNQASYYATLRHADIDGDGQEELMLRDAEALDIWKYDEPSGKWFSIAYSPELPDSAGWYSSQYRDTLHLGDIDGDGRAELIARYKDGIHVWKFINRSFQEISLSPQWTNDGTDGAGAALDDAGGAAWDQVEYYDTIRLVRVKGDAAANLANPNNPNTFGDTVFALVGRDKYGIQTWRYNVASNTFQRTSAPMPDLTSNIADADMKAGYDYLTSYFGLANGGLRHNYNNTDFDFQSRRSALFSPAPGNYYQTPRPTPSLAKPSTVSDSAKWQALCWQLYWEMIYIQHIQHWFGVDIAALLDAVETADQATLNAVADYLSIPGNSSTSLGLNLLTTLSRQFLKIGALVELPVPFAVVLGGLLGAAVSALKSLSDNGGQFQGTLAQLQTTLLNNYNQAIANNAQLELAITGGDVVENGSFVYQLGQWGPLFVLGQMIESGALVYPEKQDADPKSPTYGQIIPDNLALV